MTLISKNRNQSASGICANGFGSKIPTLFTSTSTAGSFAMMVSAAAELEKSRGNSVYGRTWCARSNSVNGCIHPFAGASVHVNAGPFAGQRLRDGQSDPGG